MNDEELLEKLAALASKDGNIHQPLALVEEPPHSIESSIPEHTAHNAELENNLTTINGNANDGLNEELWPPFC